MFSAVTVVRSRFGVIELNRFLSVPWLKTVLIAGRPIRSIWVNFPFVRRAQLAHSPTLGSGPSVEFGTSSAIPNTFLSAKKSPCVKSNPSPFTKLEEAQQIEEERVTPEPGEELVLPVLRDVGGRTERDGRACDHDLAARAQPCRLAPADDTHIGLLLAVGLRRERESERHIGDRVAVRIDVQLVQRLRG